MPGDKELKDIDSEEIQVVAWSKMGKGGRTSAPGLWENKQILGRIL